MRITIIGAGNVGRAVARAAARAGHTVTLTATDPAHAQAVADEVGGTAAPTLVDATREADVIVLAVPYGAVADVARELRDTAAGKVVIDVTNPLKPDYSGLAVSDRSGAEEIADQLSGARVVKAFNTVFASKQADPMVDGTPLDGLYAGDDDQAKNTVRDLLAAIGFRPVDAGPLSAARSLEHMAFLNISLNARNGWSWQSAWKLVGPTA
jgi:NADPH-dependent F420 reductase